VEFPRVTQQLRAFPGAVARHESRWIIRQDYAVYRDGPYQAHDVKGSFTQNAEITVIGFVNNAHGNRWYKIQGDNWIYSGNVSTTKPASVQPEYRWISREGYAVFRVRPYQVGNIAGQFSQHERIRISHAKYNSHQNKWYRLQDHNAYIYSGNVTATQPTNTSPPQPTPTSVSTTSPPSTPTPVATTTPTPNNDTNRIYNMQTDPEWEVIKSLTNHSVMRGVPNSSGGTTNVIHGMPRELNLVGRSGTSQGLRIRANTLLNALSDKNHKIRIEYSGRLNVSGNSQIRIEQSPAPDWEQGVNIWTATTGDGNVFTQIITLTHEHLQSATTVGMGDITLGASPGTAELTITNVIITVVPITEQPIPSPTPQITITPTPTSTPIPSPPPSQSFLMRFVINNTNYTYRGNSMSLDAAPFIAEGRTMVPFRAIAEGLGADVEWDASARAVRFTADDTNIFLPIGIPLSGNMGTPIIANNRTFVPVRYVAEVFGSKVDWDAASRAVYIYGN